MLLIPASSLGHLISSLKYSVFMFLAKNFLAPKLYARFYARVSDAMTSSVVVLTLLLLMTTTTAWSRDDVVNYQLLEESPAGTLLGNLIKDVRGLASAAENRLRFSIVTSHITSSAQGQFEVGERDGRLMTSSQIDREEVCPYRDVTECVIQLDVAVRPLSVFRLIKVAVTVIDINDNSPAFLTPRYQLNVSEAVFSGASFSLPAAEDQDVGINGRIEYQLLPRPSDNIFQLVQGVNVADGSTDVKLVLRSALDREQVLYISTNQTWSLCASILSYCIPIGQSNG